MKVCNRERKTTLLDSACEYLAYYIAHFTTYLLDNSVIGEYFNRNYIYEQMKKKIPFLLRTHS